VAPATEPSTSDSVLAESGSTESSEDFGANDCLLEEMYEQYTADPSSVDQAWV
jgi:2-oxoglutarate dehydrogenase E1 component